MSLITTALTAFLLLQSIDASPARGDYHGKGRWGTHTKVVAPDVTTTPIQASVVATVLPVGGASTATGAAPSSGTSVPSNSSSGRRGVSFNKIADLTAFSGQSKISWTYNWYSNPNGAVPSGITYYPMLWSSRDDHTSVWFDNAKKAIKGDFGNPADTLLAFNEPDHDGQANMQPGAAASAYKQYMQPFADGSGQAGGLKARLASPAVTNGPNPMGLAWLKSFISACTGCKIDVVAVHWYGPGSDPDNFIQHIKDAYAAGGNRPLWVTEFAPDSSNPSQPEVINNFFAKVLPFLDSFEGVEKYAYFFDAVGAQSVSNGKITSVGSTYASA